MVSNVSGGSSRGALGVPHQEATNSAAWNTYQDVSMEKGITDQT